MVLVSRPRTFVKTTSPGGGAEVGLPIGRNRIVDDAQSAALAAENVFVLRRGPAHRARYRHVLLALKESGIA